MLSFLTKNRKGFTIIELLVVLVLLSVGVLALANMFKVTYRSFQKAEERYEKQEAVKYCAEALAAGRTNVAAAEVAEIYSRIDVVPPGDVSVTTVSGEKTVTVKDKSYSYLYAKPHENEKGELDGYYLCVLEQGMTEPYVLSNVPIYVSITPMQEIVHSGGTYEYQCGVIVTLAALESDYDYSSGIPPISDDIYYSLDVAYHFPNMLQNGEGNVVNYPASGGIAKTTLYDQTNGDVTGTVEATHCDENCSIDHCGCDCGDKCFDCDCLCTYKSGVVLKVLCDSIISGDTTSSAIGVPSMCFIATASYGENSGEVGLLCDFRDKCLLTNPLGEAFVKAYYKLSPPIADFIRESEPLKAAVRVALKPLVAVATNALDENVATENAPWFIMFMLCGAGATVTLIKINKRKKKSAKE